MIGNRDELTANKSITQNIILCNGGPMEKNRRMRDILRSLCAAPPARLACRSALLVRVVLSCRRPRRLSAVSHREDWYRH